MKRLFERSRYVVVIGAVGCAVASLAAMLWGILKTASAVMALARDPEHGLVTVAFIEVMDAFLIAVALGLFGTALYELFIEDLDLPEWTQVKNLHQLKVRLSSVVVLVLGIKFLEAFAHGTPARDILFSGLGIAAVAGALIAFCRFVPDD